MDYVEKLEKMTVGDFIVTLESSSRHEFGPHSINRRVCGFLKSTYGYDASMWDVVVDGPQEWSLAGGCGPKIIEALAKAINTELGATVVDVAIPAKAVRGEGYFWTQERLAEAAAMLDKGMTRSDVGKHFGRHPDGLKAALKRYGMYKPRFTGKWYSIETAPKDGTVIIVYEPGFYQTAAWEANEFKAGWSNASGSWVGDVTHWMPLPPPPK